MARKIVTGKELLELLKDSESYEEFQDKADRLFDEREKELEGDSFER